MIAKNVTMGRNCVIDPQCHLGYEEKKGSIKLGNDVKVRHGAVVRSCTGHIVIGDNVVIGYYSVIHGLGGVTIGNNVMVTIHAQNHGVAKSEIMYLQKNTGLGISIGDDVWIGANSVICDGSKSKLATGCILGAGAVLTKSAKTNPYEIWAGNPAKKIGERE